MTLFILIIVKGSAFSQVDLQGNVTDTLFNSIPFAQVVLKLEHNNKIIAFTQANNQGDFKLKVLKSGAYTLTVSALGFHPYSKRLDIQENLTHEFDVFNVVLRSKLLEINEIIVLGERPITIKKDTIIYSVSSFVRGNEQVAEDVLKLLPGLDVENGGKVTFKGKEVEKIMVEGDDLFGKGYQIISKNLHANNLEKVEVIEHYSENSLLKDIEESEKVALNLKLTKNTGFSVFGNTSLGYSTNKNHEIRSTLMSLKEKSKIYLFGNSNSIGYNPSGDIQQFLNPHSNEEKTEFENNFNPSFIINLTGQSPNLKEQRVKFNNSKMISLNTILNPSKRLKVKVISFFDYQKDNYFRDSYQKYLSESISFTNTENYRFYDKQKLGFLSIELNYRFNKNSSLEYKALYSQTDGNGKSYLSINLDNTDESLRNSSQKVNQQMIFTKKIGNQSAFIINSRYFYDYRPENYYVNKCFFEELFPEIQGIESVNQRVFSKTQFTGIELKVITRLGKYNVLDLKTGSSYIFNSFKSNLYLLDTLNKQHNTSYNYNNNYKFDNIDLYFGIKSTSKFKSFTINGILNFHHHFTNTTLPLSNSIDDSFSFIEPKVGINWAINTKNSIQSVIAINTSTTSINEMYKSNILTGYRNFQQGLGQFSFLKGSTFLFSYKYGSLMEKMFVNFFVLYNNSSRYLTGSNLVNSNYSFSSRIFGKEKEMLIGSVTTDLYIKPFSSNLKLRVSSTQLKYDNVFNGVGGAIFSQNVEFGSELRSAFRGIFNYHIGTLWSSFLMKSNANYSNLNNSQFLDLFFTFNKKLNVKIHTERYFFGSIENEKNPWYFLDTELNYDIIPNKWSMGFYANNLFNTTEFGSYFISDVSENSTTYRIVQRNFLLKVNYRF